MSAIHTGDLRAEGLNGLGTILEFRLEEMPGAHSTAMMVCRVDTGKAAGLPGEPVCDRTITIYRAGADRPVYSGMIRRGSVTEENGVQTMRLDLVSGTFRMDLAKRDRSWQDTGMSYGTLFRQVAARAGAGVLYPSYLDSRLLGIPRVQYQETDWEFLKRMAGHFGLPLYPEPTGGGARVSVGIPETGAPVELEWTEYTAVAEGSSHDRGRLLSYEVESREVHACGERTAFQGRELTICGRTCESRKGELIFTCRLARPEWASQRRLSNEKLSGLSLLGTVLSREEETLRLKLDIDRDHPDQNQGNEYPFPWRPATGNLMYLMPSKGSRVSLYFKNGDESSATAVNCIRQEGEGTENEYRKRSLRTEHQKELKLYPDRMGVISPEAHVLLDDLEGLSVRGKKSLKILSAGKVSVSGQTVTLNTGKGKLSVYHGHAEAEEDGTVVFVKDAEFHHKEDGTKADSLGDRTCLCAYEKEDYSGNEYRFRDDPVEENYDYTGLAVQVMGGLVIVGGVTLVSGGVAAAVGAGVGATMIMGATAVGGTTFVAGLAVTDLISRTEEYMKAALAGSVVGALTGAAELVPVSGLARVGVDFLAGVSGSAAGQLITEGEVDAERVFREGVLAAVMAAGARMLRGGIKANIEENADIPVEKRYRGGDGEIPRSGEEWCEYFEEKYGAENVEWLTKNGYNLYFNKKYVNANFFRNSYGIVSSASGGGVPKGKYEIPDPNDPAPIQGQNEAADFLAMKGFNIEMLPNKNGGNGYGIKATSNPDYLIEGKVFDCYTPKRGTSIRNIGSVIEKKTLSQTNNIVLNLEQSDVNVSQITKQLAEYPIDSLGQLIIIKNNQYYLLAN